MSSEKSRTPADLLAKVIEHPSRKTEKNQGQVIDWEKNIKRIEQHMGAFQASAEADIAKLLQFDHQDIKNAVTDKAYKESLRNIRENYDVLRSLIQMLSEAPQSEGSDSTIASLETLLQSVEDSLVSHDYRKQNSLPSAEKQVEEYIASISQLKGEEAVPNTVTEKFSHQPDIVEMYHLGLQEYSTAQRIIDADYSVSEVLDYVDQLVEHGDPTTWTEQNCQTVLDVVKVLEKFKELTLFRTQAEAQLLKLQELLGTKMTEASSIELVVDLGIKANEIPNTANKEIEEIGKTLEDLLFSKSAVESDGWIDADIATATKLLKLAQLTKKNLGKARLFTYTKILTPTAASNERATIDAQIAFCELVEKFATKLKSQPKQLQLLKPIAKELNLKAPYILLYEQTEAQKQAEETAQAA